MQLAAKQKGMTVLHAIGIIIGLLGVIVPLLDCPVSRPRDARAAPVIPLGQAIVFFLRIQIAMLGSIYWFCFVVWVWRL